MLVIKNWFPQLQELARPKSKRWAGNLQTRRTEVLVQVQEQGTAGTGRTKNPEVSKQLAGEVSLA